MAAPVIDQGAVIAVLVAQLSIEEIDNVVTGDRRWRQEGFGATGEAYVVGPDRLVRSGPRAFHENPEQYFVDLKHGGESDEKHRRHPPLRVARAASDGKLPRLFVPPSPALEGTGEIIGYRGAPTLASWGAARNSRHQMGADRQDRR